MANSPILPEPEWSGDLGKDSLTKSLPFGMTNQWFAQFSLYHPVDGILSQRVLVVQNVLPSCKNSHFRITTTTTTTTTTKKKLPLVSGLVFVVFLFSLPIKRMALKTKSNVAKFTESFGSFSWEAIPHVPLGLAPLGGVHLRHHVSTRWAKKAMIVAKLGATCFKKNQKKKRKSMGFLSNLTGIPKFSHPTTDLSSTHWPISSRAWCSSVGCSPGPLVMSWGSAVAPYGRKNLKKNRPIMSCHGLSSSQRLVGGWTNPFEKY